MSEEQIVFNGISMQTGDYSIPPMTLQELSTRLEQETLMEKHQLAILRARESLDKARLEAQDSVKDIQKLEEAGWGIIFPKNMNAGHLKALIGALQPLLALRKQQAGEYYKMFCGEKGYQTNDTLKSWLPRQGMSPIELADPCRVPYYLLLVGSPEEIPFTFQCDLDVTYAVGRLYFEQAEGETFEDTLTCYASYAQSVANTESRDGFLQRKAAFFGVANDYDEHTERSSRWLVEPLARTLQQDYQKSWEILSYLKEQATKATLSQLINGAIPPALLFTASHGLEATIPPSHAQRLQGALICQDWPGPPIWSFKRKGLEKSFFFSADDVSDSATLSGRIFFHFACYGFGTTRFTQYTIPVNQPPPAKDFIAYLPQRLLSHHKGGALAVIGNVNQALGYSFIWPGLNEQINTMKDVLSRLMTGKRAGWAMERLNRRHAASGIAWSNKLIEMDHYLAFDKDEEAQKDLAAIWMTYVDARNYFLLGDPAVKLPLANINT